MGHANILLASKIYTHNSEIAFENAAAAINKYHSKSGDTASDTSEPEKSRQKQYEA